MAAGTVRQRRGKGTPSTSKSDSSTDTTTPKTSSTSSNSPKQNAPPIWLRFFLFLMFPTMMGTLGLLTSYLNEKDFFFSTSGKSADHELNFDRDFMYPFLLTLALVSVLWYQTKAFSSNQVTPLVAWPKVKRRRKIIRTTKIVDDDEEEEEDVKEEEETITPTPGKRTGSRKED